MRIMSVLVGSEDILQNDYDCFEERESIYKLVMADQSEHIFVKSTDSQYVDIVFSILRKCGYNMARKGLFHWIPSYSKRAIRKDCMSHWVVCFLTRVWMHLRVRSRWLS
jgi:hypothetical protein